MNYTTFRLDIHEQVAHIQFTRPEKRNALSREFWDELPAAIHDIDNGARARAIVLSSTGPHFTSGLDVGMFAENGIAITDVNAKREARKQRPAYFMQQLALLQDSFTVMENCRMPVLAAVQGGCIGGGVDMITACDMRYATKDAFFTIFEIKVGMTADVGTFPRAVKLLPEGVVKELAYTGRRMPADEAYGLGFVNRVYETQDEMLKGVMEIAAEIASHPPMAIYGCKRAINFARDHSTQDGLDWIGMWNASMLHGDEIQESMLARQEKRAGKFTDLPKKQLKIS